MGETVSEDREYTFVAKYQVRLKAVFTPKNVLHVDTYARVPFLITTHDVVSTPDRRFSYCGAIESFYPGEEIFVYAYFYSPIVRVELSRYYRFAWRISYTIPTGKYFLIRVRHTLKSPKTRTRFILKRLSTDLTLKTLKS